MENISLNTGEVVTIDGNKGIVEVVEERLSHDLASVLDGKLIEIDEEKMYAEELAQTDAEAYLADLEDKQSSLQEVLEMVEELQEYVKGRVNKDKLWNKLQDIEDIILKGL